MPTICAISNENRRQTRSQKRQQMDENNSNTVNFECMEQLPLKPTQQITRKKPAEKRKRAALGDISNQHTAGGARTRSTKNALGAKKKTALNVVKKKQTNVTKKRRMATKVSTKGPTKVQTKITTKVEVKKSKSLEVQARDNIKPQTITVVEQSSQAIEIEEQQQLSGVENIDLRHMGNPRYCVDLMDDLDAYWRCHELKYAPSVDYIENIQSDMNAKMRTILVDWLIEVAQEYNLRPQTTYITINLIDRSLGQFQVSKNRLQLLGCACMLIASKYEEIIGPCVDDFVYISDHTYSSQEMLNMERLVLEKLKYCICVTTTYTFLTRFCRAGLEKIHQRALAEYLSELALLDYSMLKFRSSMLASSVIYLTRVTTHEDEPWTSTLCHYSGYKAWELYPCVRILHRLHAEEQTSMHSNNTRAVSEKYMNEDKYAVSKIPFADEEELNRFLKNP